MAKICLHAFISGKVQGVWYRQSAREQAQKHQVTGWANNLSDGRVETLLCGEEADVLAVANWLEQGPVKARVDSVETEILAYRELSSFTTG